MAVGISSYLANKLLDHATGRASFTVPAGCYAKIHTGDPGANGTANASAVTTRAAVTFAAATGGAISMNNTPEFTLTGSETISHVSFWDASNSGNFLWSASATVSKAGGSGDIIRISTEQVTLGALAS